MMCTGEQDIDELNEMYRPYVGKGMTRTPKVSRS